MRVSCAIHPRGRRDNHRAIRMLGVTIRCQRVPLGRIHKAELLQPDILTELRRQHRAGLQRGSTRLMSNNRRWLYFDMRWTGSWWRYMRHHFLAIGAKVHAVLLVSNARTADHLSK